MSKRRRIPSRPKKPVHVGRLGALGATELGLKALPESKLVARVDNVAVTKEVDGKPGVLIDFTMEVKPDLMRQADPGFDPWSTSQEDAIRRPGGLGSPEFALWASARLIQGRRARIESDGIALLEAVQVLLVAGLRAPPWLAEAFKSRYRLFERYEARTLDETFGHTPLDPRTVAERRNARQLFHKVHEALIAAVAADPTLPIHADHPFEQVGHEFGLGKTKTYELYREAVDEHSMQDLSDYRRLLLYTRGIPEK